jgi:hypothetical protein
VGAFARVVGVSGSFGELVACVGVPGPVLIGVVALAGYGAGQLVRQVVVALRSVARLGGWFL